MNKKTAYYFKNDQWQVTNFGLESIKPHPTYPIGIKQLGYKAGRGKGGREIYDFPIQMAEKNWVDLVAFCEAFRQALHYHGYSSDGELIQVSIDAAFSQRR